MPPNTIKILIAGKPNVGKSTLFNRLVGKKIALTGKIPGLTRDRREEHIQHNQQNITLIDSAGFETAKKNPLHIRINQHTIKAAQSADIILFLIDAKNGITLDDHEYAQIIRKMNKKIILVANKTENKKAYIHSNDATKLGFGNPIPISAEHAIGLDQIYDAISNINNTKHISQENPNPKTQNKQDTIKLALVGRPNSGKSTLINQIIGQDRLITGPEAGITRDAISIHHIWNEHNITITDTAGMRRKAKITQNDETIAVKDALNAVKNAQICLILIDATQPFEKQDLQIGEMVAKQGCAVIFALNKWDQIKQTDKKDTLKNIIQYAHNALPQIKGADIIPISALSGQGCQKLMRAITQTHKQTEKRIPTAKLNQWFETVTNKHPPPAPKGKRIKMRYITQAKTNPPTFIIFCQRAKEVPKNYRRYIENQLREEFNFNNTPVKLFLRQGENPYTP